MVEFDPVLVHGWLKRSACRYPNKTALVCENQRLTYRQLDILSHNMAGSFRSLGVQRHDRVAIFTDNCVEAVIALYAILKAGAVFVLVSSSVKDKKLRYLLDDSQASLLIASTTKASVVSGALRDVTTPCELIWVGSDERVPDLLQSVSRMWDVLVEEGGYDTDRGVEEKRTIDIDLAALIYTSGSTGEPKGIMSTHQNMVSAARSIIQYLGNEPEDVILSVLPLSFDYGLYQVLMSVMFGGTVILEKSFAYIDQVLRRIAQERVTGFPIVPTVVAMLLRLRNLLDYDFSSLRYMTNTGAALPSEHIQQLRKRLPDVTLYSMFGLTECKRVSFLPPDELDRRLDSVGKAMPNCEVILVDPEGRAVAPGETGELVIRGSNVMQGYWNAPALTQGVYRPGGYPADRRLYSGDFFRWDEEGYLYFLGRRDDMIKCKGERVSAREVENFLHTMAEVLEVAVIGVDDEIQGQAIKAFLVPREGKQINTRDVARYCAQNLENFMIPKYINILSALPKTANGKIDKKQLLSC